MQFYLFFFIFQFLFRFIFDKLQMFRYTFSYIYTIGSFICRLYLTWYLCTYNMYYNIMRYDDDDSKWFLNVSEYSYLKSSKENRCQLSLTDKISHYLHALDYLLQKLGYLPVCPIYLRETISRYKSSLFIQQNS